VTADRPIRIMQVITDLDIGGAETMLYRMATGLDPARVQTAVLSLTSHGHYGPQLQAKGIPVAALGLRRQVPDPLAVARGLAGIRRFTPDVIQTWLYHADFFGLLANRGRRIPLVWNLRCSDMELSHYGLATRFLRRALARLSTVPDVVVANSEAGMLAHGALGYRPRRWEVIPNGFDFAQFRPDPEWREAGRRELGAAEGELVVALPARLDPMKDHDTFLAAAARIDPREPIRFVLVGRGTQPGNDAMDALVARHGLEGRVIRLGPRGDLARLYPAIDVVTLSSAFGEGFPNVLGEAMAAGCLAVSTDVGDARAILGEFGTVVPRRDPAALAEAWRAALRLGPDGRRRAALQARASAAARFSLRAIVQRYEALYRSLGESACGGRRCAA